MERNEGASPPQRTSLRPGSAACSADMFGKFDCYPKTAQINIWCSYGSQHISGQSRINSDHDRTPTVLLPARPLVSWVGSKLRPHRERVGEDAFASYHLQSRAALRASIVDSYAISDR